MFQQYIALERLESTYKSCNLVSNICVHAYANAKQPIAIIIPHEPHLRHALEEAPIAGIDPREELHALCEHEKVQALVMRECNALGKKNAFKPMELLEAVVLTADEWTPENGLVTAAQKVQRKKVAERFAEEIKACRSRLRVGSASSVDTHRSLFDVFLDVFDRRYTASSERGERGRWWEGWRRALCCG